MSKRPRALLLVVTGSLGFAAAQPKTAGRHSVVQRRRVAARRRSSAARSGRAAHVFYAAPGTFAPDAVRRFSLPAPARFEGFRLLDEYRTVLWLEVATERAQSLLERPQADLTRERALRESLERAVRRLSPPV